MEAYDDNEKKQANEKAYQGDVDTYPSNPELLAKKSAEKYVTSPLEEMDKAEKERNRLTPKLQQVERPSSLTFD